jgi:hypothetical protein
MWRFDFFSGSWPVAPAIAQTLPLSNLPGPAMPIMRK